MTRIAIIGQGACGALDHSQRSAGAHVAFWRRGDGAASMLGTGERRAQA